MQFSKMLAAAIFAVSLGASAEAATVVVNGTFDNNRTGWTGSYQLRNSGPTINTGTYFFAGATGYTEIRQVYSLTAPDIDSLDGPGLNFDMSADLFGYQNQYDFSRFSASFRDAGGSQVGYVFLDSRARFPGNWGTTLIAGTSPIYQAISGLLPSATRSILFSVSATRTAGTNNDGYADNVSFSLSPVAAVPLPAGLALLSAAFASLGVFSFRKRRLELSAKP